MMEWKHLKPDQQQELMVWAKKHGLEGERCGQDMCFNYHPLLNVKDARMHMVFYGARKSIPKHTWVTSEASKAYYFYGT
jgi:hypothetical protein